MELAYYPGTGMSRWWLLWGVLNSYNIAQNPIQIGQVTFYCAWGDCHTGKEILRQSLRLVDYMPQRPYLNRKERRRLGH